MSATEPQLEPKAGAYAWYVAGLLAVAHIFSLCDRFLMSLVLDLIKKDLHFSDTQLGIIHGFGFVVLFAFVTIPIGRLTDVVNRRLLIAAGILVWSAATAMTGAAEDFWSMFGARVLVGVGEATLVPAALSLLASFFPQFQLGRAAAIFAMGGPLGRATALLGGGALLGVLTVHGAPLLFPPWETPWRFLFLVAGILGIPIAFLVWRLRPPPSEATRGRPATLGESVAQIRTNWSAYATISVTYAIQTAIISALGAWNVSYFIRTHDLTITQAGTLAGLIGLLVAPLGSLSGGWINDWLGARGRRDAAVIITAFVGCMATVSMIVFGMSSLLLTAVLAYAVTQFLVSMSGPPTLASIQFLTPQQFRGFATSLYFVVVGLVGACGPALVGFLSDKGADGTLGLGGALASLCVVLGLSSATVALVGRGAYVRSRLALQQDAAGRTG